MRFFSTVVAALPALAAAQDGIFGQYQAQFQNFLGNMGAYVPNPGKHDPVAALEAKLGSMRLHTLTLDNWKETLYEPVLANPKVPAEWWVLFSGRNKTCPMGRCDRIEQAFNETAAKFAVLPSSPRMAFVNCDDQPIFCTSVSGAVGVVWAFDLVPPPAEIDIYAKRYNWTHCTSNDMVADRNVDKTTWAKIDSWFHPFNGKVTEMGLAVPFGYLTWGFGLVPNWLFMIVVSMISRTMMGNRMSRMPGGPNAAGQARPAAS